MISGRFLLAVAVAALLAACGSDGLTVPAGTLIEVRGSGARSINVTETITTPLSVVVTGSSGAPEVGANVVWTVVSGGGTLTPLGPTNDSGVATATYQAGITSGAKK